MKTEVTYEFTLEAEDTHPRDTFAYDTEEENEDAARWVIEQLESGNEYAWFCAKVVARVETSHYVYESEPQYLGCCSYRSREDFLKGAYYTAMCKEALGSLRHEIEETIAKGAEAARVLKEVFK